MTTNNYNVCVVQCDIFRGIQGYNLGNGGKYGVKIKISVLSFKLTFLPAENFQIYRSRGFSLLHSTIYPGSSLSLFPTLAPLSHLSLFPPQSKLSETWSDICKSKKTNSTHHPASTSINTWPILFHFIPHHLSFPTPLDYFEANLKYIISSVNFSRYSVCINISVGKIKTSTNVISFSSTIGSFKLRWE